MTDEPPPPIRHVTSRRIIAVRGDSLEIRDDRVVGEAPLEIRAAGPQQEPVAVAVTMRTPGYRGRARRRASSGRRGSSTGPRWSRPPAAIRAR